MSWKAKTAMGKTWDILTHFNCIESQGEGGKYLSFLSNIIKELRSGAQREFNKEGFFGVKE